MPRAAAPLALLVLAGTGAAARAAAPPVAPPPDKPPVADFSDALDKLAALGVTLPAGAKLVSYELLANLRTDSGEKILPDWEAPVSPRDLYWVAPDGTTVVAVPAGSAQRLVSTSRSIAGGDAFIRREAVLDRLRNASDPVSGYVDRLSVFDSRRRASGAFGGTQDRTLGANLLFAAQLKVHGDTALANRVASQVFRMASSRKAVVERALNSLAEDRYDAALISLSRDGDWKTFADTLHALIETFPRGWAGRKAASVLADRVAARLSVKPRPLPVVPGCEALAVVLETGGPDIRDVRFGRSAEEWNFWTLPVTGAEKTRNGEDPGTPPVPVSLRTAGLAAAGFLLALEGDDTPTPLHGYLREDDVPEETRLPEVRPLSRAECARSWLGPVLPPRYLEEADGDVFKASSAFLHDHGKDSPEALARFYLAEGEAGQGDIAFDFLLPRTDSVSRAAIETYLLDPKNLADHFRHSRRYVFRHGVAAKDFADRYVVALKRMRSGDDDAAKKARGRVSDGEIALMNRLAAGESVESIFTTFIAGKRWSSDEADGCFRVLLSEGSLAKAFSLVLRLTASPEALPAAREWALGELDCYKSCFEPRGETYRPTPEDVPYWKALLADRRALPSGGDTPFLAARALERFFDTAGFLSRRGYEGDPDPESGVVMRRARARLTGGEIPRWPDEDRVSGKRLRELADKIAALPDADIPGFLKTLSDDERFAWSLLVSDWRDELGESGGRPAKMAMPAAWKNRAANYAGLAPTSDGQPVSEEDRKLTAEILAEAGLSPGDRLDRAAIIRSGDALAKHAERYSGVCIRFFMTPFSPGPRAVAHRFRLGVDDKSFAWDFRELLPRFRNEDGSRPPEAVVRFSWDWFWKIGPGTVVPPDFSKIPPGRNVFDEDFRILSAKDAAVLNAVTRDKWDSPFN